MFGDLPEKHRPRCNKLDENGLCPKGVPTISKRLVDFWQIYSLLSTQAIDPETGLLRFSSVLIRDLGSLFGVGEQETARLSGQLLYAIDLANGLRLERMKAKREGKESKFKGTEKA